MNHLLHKSSEQLEKEYALIVKAQASSNDFEPLYNQNFERIFRFVYQRVESKEEAADITSQVFLKALLNLQDYQYRKIPFSAWLYRIAINEISSFYSKSNKNRVVNIETVQLNKLFEESDQNLKEERIERIILALKHLKGEELMLLELRFFEDHSFKEIGEIMGITENNAKVKVYRVIDKLKQKIV
jgi:RNA polymerase sigma-70 factor, ECF subfamily